MEVWIMKKFRCALSLMLTLVLLVQCLSPAAAAANLTKGTERSLDEIKSDLYAYYSTDENEVEEASPAEPLPAEAVGASDPAPAEAPVLAEEAEPMVLFSVTGTDFRYEVLSEGTCSITGYTGSDTEVVIPSQIDGYSVVRISANAFYNNQSITSVTIPEGVYEIRFYAFSRCSALKTVVLPDSLEAIGYEAFAHCTSLETINYPKSLNDIPGNTSNYSSGSIFVGCTSLTHITVPEGVTFLPDKVFNSASYLRSVTLPSTLTSIGNNAFIYSGITSITIPDSVTTIGANAFAGCGSLQSVQIGTSQSNLTVISSGCFQNCTALKDVTLPAGLTEVAFYAFRGCSALESLVLPDSLATIGYEAFAHCTSLETVNYPKSLSSIPGNTTTYSSGCIFGGCKSLSQITVPEGVTFLPDGVFKSCNYLRSVILPSTLTKIGNDAFVNSGITSITIPDSVTTIGSSAFSSCGNLRWAVLPTTLTTIGSNAFVSCGSLQSVRIDGTETSLKTISESCFSNCTSLKEVPFAWGLKTIGEYAFKNCTSLGAITLPDSLTTISAYAFMDCTNLELEAFPATLKSIGSGAFLECRSLKRLHVPNSVTSIQPNAFLRASNVEFLCSAFSYAASFAIDQGIPMVDTEEPAPANTFLDRQQCSYRINGDGLSAAGTLNMVANYNFNSGQQCTNAKLTFNLPTSLTMIENTLTVNGTLCTNYEITDTSLTVPVQATSGTVRFTFKPKTYDRFTAYCKINFKNGSQSYSEVLGSVYQELPTLTLSCPAETAHDPVTVTGVTTPGNEVTLTVNGTEAMTVKANKAGNFSADLPLSQPKQGDTLSIGATAAGPAGQILSTTRETTFDDHAPELTLFEMTYRGSTINLLSEERPSLVWWYIRNQPTSFGFKAKLRQYDDVVSVYITSSRNNVKKYMPATWSESEQAYVASGSFEGTDPSYMPGRVGVEIVRDHGTVSFLSKLDDLLQEYKIPEGWKDSDCTINSNTEDSSDYYVDIPDEGKDDYALRYRTNKSTKANYTEADAIADGYTKVTDDEGNVRYIRETATPSGMSVSTISDIGNGAAEICDILIDCYTVVLEEGQKVYAPLDTLSTGMDILGVLVAYNDLMKDAVALDKLQTHIKNSDASDSNKAVATKKVYQAQTVNMVAFFLKLGLVVAGSAAIAVGTGPLGIVTAANLLLMNGVIDMYKEFFLEVLHESALKWLIDPSGYIYDLETKRRIHGATVTVFWIPCEEPDESYWNNKPTEDEYGTKWNAAEYSMCNPVTTNDLGQYGWDVPEGWWRVCCEAPGYETVWSEWLPVPPPQLEVNLGMTRTAPAFTLELTDSTASSATVCLTNTCCYESNAQVFLAAYNSAGKMIALNVIEEVPAVSGSTSMTISCNAREVISSVKLFAADSLTRPFITPLEIEFAQ